MPGLPWSTMTRDEIRTALTQGTLVVLPTAATEQHGPHLPTGHDSITVEHIAQAAADIATSDVVVAPVLRFGSSQHHIPFGGTLSLSTETYYRVARELVESILASGATRVLLLNGHGGNQQLNELVVRDVALEQEPDAGIMLAAASYWQIAERSLAPIAQEHGMSIPGHAGMFETATMLAMDPSAVRPRWAERAGNGPNAPTIPGVRLETAGLWQIFDGYTDRPDIATAELGETILDAAIRDVAALYETLANT
ncbi:MAG: creatininase family protein [Thermomicrobiales bacterium]